MCQIASEAAVKVVMDCGGVEEPISPELLTSVTILSPNETELARLTGKATPLHESKLGPRPSDAHALHI